MAANDSNVYIRTTEKEVGLRYYWNVSHYARPLIGLSPASIKSTVQ